MDVGLLVQNQARGRERRRLQQLNTNSRDEPNSSRENGTGDEEVGLKGERLTKNCSRADSRTPHRKVNWRGESKNIFSGEYKRFFFARSAVVWTTDFAEIVLQTNAEEQINIVVLAVSALASGFADACFARAVGQGSG